MSINTLENYSAIEVRGVIRIFEKDKSGRALQLYIQTENFEKLIIDETEKSNELFSYIDKEVLINGKRYTHVHHTFQHIEIESFSLLTNNRS